MPRHHDREQRRRRSESFPVGGGEVAELIRQRDWSSCPLGPVDRWPDRLRQSLENALNTTFPISIVWGEELLQFYNDAYGSVMMGSKHPDALGRPVRENWPDFWPELRGFLQQVRRRGGPVQQQEMKIFVPRGDDGQEIYFNFSVAPIFGEHKDVEGILISVVDTTERVVSRRRLRTLSDLGAALSTADDSRQMLPAAVEAISGNDEDIPFALLYTCGHESHHARATLTAHAHLEPETVWSPSFIEVPGDDAAGDPLAEVLRECWPRIIDLETALGPAPESFSEAGPRQAMVAPMTVRTDGKKLPLGVLIFGLNPSLPFDDDYADFLHEIVRHVSVAYHNLRRREEQLDLFRTRAELIHRRIESDQLRERARLIDSIELPFVAFDDQWRVVYANDAIRSDAHLLPTGQRQVVGQNYWDLLAWARETDIYDTFQQVRASGEPAQFMFEFPEREHTYEARVFCWEQGVAAAFADVSEQRRIQRALKRSEARFRAVVEASLDVIAITDADGRFEFVSPAAEPVLNRDPDSLVGVCVFDLVTPDDVDRARRAFHRLEEEPTEPAQVQVRSMCPADGDQPHWLSIKGRNLLDDPGIGGMLINIRDITDTKRREAQLVEAKEKAEEVTRLKSSILANTSHEIRTPLTSMIGMANILAQQVPPRQARLARNIEKSGSQLSRTLDSVLTLAKIESDALEVTTEQVSLVEEAEDCIETLMKLAADEQLQLQLEADEHPVVCADRNFVASILNNLVGNAIKFTDEGSVTVRVRDDGRRGIIEVEDTGIGIHHEFLPHLYEEFRQESTGLARRHEGSGLGLTIACRMVEAMDGTLTVMTTPGTGSTFTVTLPLAKVTCLRDQPAREEEGPAEPARDAELTRPSVLVVEDDESIRFMLDQLLQRDFRPTLVSDGKSALKITEHEQFDLLVLDIGLPDMDGIELMKRLRERSWLRDVPIVALTGYVLPDEQQRYASEKFDAHISKPFDPDTLIGQLQSLLD